MTHLCERHGVSERRACAVARQKRSSQRYQSQKNDGPLQEKLLRHARQRPRFGYRRLQVFVRREGDFSNIKRVRRVYRELDLCVKKRKGRKRAIGTRLPVLSDRLDARCFPSPSKCGRGPRGVTPKAYMRRPQHAAACGMASPPKAHIST